MLTDDAIHALRTAELPLLEREVYLDHATIGPLPRRHVVAATEVLERHASSGPAPGEGTRLLEEVRQEAAGLLHSEPSAVALLRSTGEGLSLIARGLDWRPGDEVVLYEREFVGCLAPFLDLRRHGVVVRWVPDRGGRFDLADVERQLTPRTRAVAVSLVSRSHGTRAPVEQLGALCRERGIWLALDAAQAMGVLDLDAPAIGADVVAAHGYKFLCSGFGLAVVHCSPRAVAELAPPLVGWKNAAIDEATELELAPRDEARRFEPTMPSLPLLAGMRASLGLLHELGSAERAGRALGTSGAIRSALLERGYTSTGSERPEEASTLVAVRHPQLDAERLVDALAVERVRCAAVDGALRLSVHALNTATDVDALLDALPRAERSAAG